MLKKIYNQNQSALSFIPPDSWIRTGTFLCTRDLLKLREVCRELKTIIDQNFSYFNVPERRAFASRKVVSILSSDVGLQTGKVLKTVKFFKKTFRLITPQTLEKTLRPDQIIVSEEGAEALLMKGKDPMADLGTLVGIIQFLNTVSGCHLRKLINELIFINLKNIKNVGIITIEKELKDSGSFFSLINTIFMGMKEGKRKALDESPYRQEIKDEIPNPELSLLFCQATKCGMDSETKKSICDFLDTSQGNIFALLLECYVRNQYFILTQRQLKMIHDWKKSGLSS